MKTIKELSAILAFTKVANAQSYSKAAKELKVSKSHLSKLIQSLEDQLGQKLLNRSTRLVKLTLLGEEFYNTAKEAITSLEIAKTQLQDSSLSPHGLLRVSVAGAFGEEYIAPIAADLLKKHPHLSIELNFDEKVVSLVKENYDIAIRVGNLNDSTLIAKKIAQRKEYICATPEYLKIHGHPKHPEELKTHTCLITNNDTWQFKDKIDSVKVSGTFKSNNARATLNAGLCSLGKFKLPEIYIKKHLDSNKLESLLESFMTQEIPIWAIYPTRKNQSTNLRVFLEAISNS
jgi:DNA-binding transcriptional LysR family regulator